MLPQQHPYRRTFVAQLALGHYDPQRLRRLASAMTTVGEWAQVIVLTSNPERFANLREAHRIDI